MLGPLTASSSAHSTTRSSRRKATRAAATRTSLSGVALRLLVVEAAAVGRRQRQPALLGPHLRRPRAEDQWLVTGNAVVRDIPVLRLAHRHTPAKRNLSGTRSACSFLTVYRTVVVRWLAFRKACGSGSQGNNVRSMDHKIQAVSTRDSSQLSFSMTVATFFSDHLSPAAG